MSWLDEVVAERAREALQAQWEQDHPKQALAVKLAVMSITTTWNTAVLAGKVAVCTVAAVLVLQLMGYLP